MEIGLSKVEAQPEMELSKDLEVEAKAEEEQGVELSKVEAQPEMELSKDLEVQAKVAEEKGVGLLKVGVPLEVGLLPVLLQEHPSSVLLLMIPLQRSRCSPRPKKR